MKNSKSYCGKQTNFKAYIATYPQYFSSLYAWLMMHSLTTGVEVLAKDDDALAGSRVRLTNVILVLPSVKLEIPIFDI